MAFVSVFLVVALIYALCAWGVDRNKQMRNAKREIAKMREAREKL